MYGCMQDPQGCKTADQDQLNYRDYLMRRLRVPAGVVFGHGLMDLALIHESEEVDSAIMQRLQANSLAELEHLFLEFYQELLQVCLSAWGQLCCARSVAWHRLTCLIFCGVSQDDK